MQIQHTSSATHGTNIKLDGYRSLSNYPFSFNILIKLWQESEKQNRKIKIDTYSNKRWIYEHRKTTKDNKR